MKKEDAKLWTKPLTPSVRKMLSEKTFPTDDSKRWEQILADTKEEDRVLAVLKCPAVDIELEMWTKDGDDYTSAPDAKDKTISLSFPIVAKVGEDAWELEDYANADCSVDFMSPTWEEDLKDEMWKLLCAHAKEHNLSLTEINDQVA